MPVMEHPFYASWGYQVSGYYAPTSRYGTPDDFRFLVDTLHQHGHRRAFSIGCRRTFPKTIFALRRFDGTALYEHDDPRLGEHPDWGTLIFNFGRNEVRNFLIANALYWLERIPRRRPARRRRRVDALSRLQPPSGRVDAESPRRPRKPRGDRVPQAVQRSRPRRRARMRHDRRRIDGVARCDRARERGRTRIHVQVEHGLDARHAHVLLARSGASPVSPRSAHVRDALRVQRAFHHAVVARRSRAPQGLAVQQNARRRLAKARQPAPAAHVHVHAPRQEVAVHGHRARVVERVESRRRVSIGICATSPIARRSSNSSRDWRRCIDTSRRCGATTRVGRALPGSTSPTERIPSCRTRAARMGRTSSLCSTSRRYRANAIESACRHPAGTSAFCRRTIGRGEVAATVKSPAPSPNQFPFTDIRSRSKFRFRR